MHVSPLLEAVTCFNTGKREQVFKASGFRQLLCKYVIIFFCCCQKAVVKHAALLASVPICLLMEFALVEAHVSSDRKARGDFWIPHYRSQIWVVPVGCAQGDGLELCGRGTGHSGAPAVPMEQCVLWAERGTAVILVMTWDTWGGLK